MKKIKKSNQNIELPENITEYRSYFSELPKEYDRSYEIMLTDCANHHTQNDFDILNTLVSDFKKKVQETDSEERGTEEYKSEEKIAYAAFYTLNIILRTSMDKKGLNELMNNNQVWCGTHDTFVHLNALRYTQTGANDEVDPMDLIQKEYDLAVTHPDNAGYCHAFCDLFATFCEKDDQLEAQLVAKWKKQALSEIERAIRLDDSYAKYYCTKGRLLAIDGRYDEADEMIREAIRREDSSRSDYVIRVNTYQFSRLQIQSKRLVEETKRQINAEKIHTEIGELRRAVVSNVEILAFFSGIMSFIIGSLSLAKEHSATHASLLIITLMGCLISVFSGFSAILHLNEEDNSKKTKVIISVVGFILAAISTMSIALL